MRVNRGEKRVDGGLSRRKKGFEEMVIDKKILEELTVKALESGSVIPEMKDGAY